MIVITGAAGFIGWNLYQAIKSHYKLPDYSEDILLVDYYHKFQGEFTPQAKMMDPDTFIGLLSNQQFVKRIKVIFHQGACTNTTEYDPHYMLSTNFDVTHFLFKACVAHNIRFIYASSASIYGHGSFKEEPILIEEQSQPRNIYAKSKKLVDDYITCYLEDAEEIPDLELPQIVGLRYFNVYGPWEHRKGKMASVIAQFYNQIHESQKIEIFRDSGKFYRDFIYIDDVINVNLHFLNHPNISGIFNCGTGQPRSFAKIPEIMEKHIDIDFDVEEIDMPLHLVDQYQTYTRADIEKLRMKGKYDKPFYTLEEGIEHYIDFIKEKKREVLPCKKETSDD